MKNWKTTLIGLLTGGGYLFLQALSSGVKLRDALLATGIVVLGAVAKDSNVTGGTVKQ
jgi:hypothetical protein